MEEKKIEYNKILQRYYNGCNYISEHLEEAEEYVPVVKKFIKKLDEIIKEIGDMTEKEKLEGFNIEQ